MQSKTWGTGEGDADSHMKDSRRLNIFKKLNKTWKDGM